MLDYLPPVLREVRDFRCLMGQMQEVLVELWEQERETEDEYYLWTATERGLSHWETILGVRPRPGSSLEARRQVILARMSQTTPYCWQTLLTLLTALLGSREDFEAEIEGYRLTVWIAPRVRGFYEAVWELLRLVVPANLGVEVVSIYNTHGQLSAMTHRAMRGHTHRQLREEELV
ncbi:MAG: YmfQ family protein [Oscillospiraceae bacterium]|nr:YmfQ family protein [Oscillospiraceae bacterium]